MSPVAFAHAAVLLALLAASANAEKPRSPKPVNVEIEVMRGGSVQIPLRGRERNLNRIIYRIIDQPRYGGLSGLTQYEGHDLQGAGHVTYTHANDDDSTTDTFAFEVVSKPGNLRGRGRVTIRIVDADPILGITPSLIDFGPSAIGDPSLRGTVELKNAGGGVLRGYLTLPPPFLVEGDGNFGLRRGESTRIPILFAPERPGDYLFRVQPVPGDPAVLTLKGEAVSPFFVDVTEARFMLESDGSRTATAIARNSSQQTQTIDVVLPEDSPVEQVNALELAADETVDVILRIPPEFKAAAPSINVRFEGAGHSQVQLFEAPAVPASLTVVSPPDFGEVRPGTVAQADLVLRNDGGVPAEAKLLDHDSIRPANGATAITVALGEQQTIPLKLSLKRDQALPADLVLSFQGRDIVVPVRAVLFAPPPTAPPPTPSPTPPPRQLWALQSDIEYLPPPHGPALRWQKKAGWENFELQHIPGGTGSWQRYELPAAHEGLIAWFEQLGRRIGKFLNTEIKRPEIDPMGTDPVTWQEEQIAESSTAADIWLLTASRGGASASAITVPFRIRGEELVAEEETAPAPQPAPAAQEAPLVAPGRDTLQLGPETKIASAGIKSDRHSALLQVAFPTELGIQSFRLEQGSMVAEIDPKTGIPGAPRFEAIQSPEASVELLGTGEGEADGKKFTVCLARISGLPGGTRTYWRLVPSGPKGDLPPTTVLLVDTQPLPPFPWNTALLVSLFLLLAGVLYLRWRVNRVPR